jgi:hypothetical protein
VDLVLNITTKKYQQGVVNKNKLAAARFLSLFVFTKTHLALGLPRTLCTEKHKQLGKKNSPILVRFPFYRFSLYTPNYF